jgi:hypothetical protein
MRLDLTACRALLDGFAYDRDDRNPPDAKRQARFKAGWRDAAERGRIYGPKSMRVPTWYNLGNRLGAHFGRTPDDGIDEAFRSFADAFEHDRR